MLLRYGQAEYRLGAVWYDGSTEAEQSAARRSADRKLHVMTRFTAALERRGTRPTGQQATLAVLAIFDRYRITGPTTTQTLLLHDLVALITP